MRIVKVLCLAVVVMMATGCSCRTRNVGPGNIPVPGDGGPLRDISFAYDSYALDSSGRAVAAANADWLKENPNATVEIEGHCDERGTNEYNMVLGSNRAKAVMDYLTTQGISSSRLTTISYGEELPLDPGHNPSAWARNRRVHHKVSE
ncbi:MAG: peptidoglycan-associated lipoprotein Pal [Bdellovibrionales bacterium]|nr:peptidoglycan-associated lipoprotein Pal [Bdellovibrionales bacterium]